MFRLIWIISIYVRSFMRRFMPSNVVITALRTRGGLKWAAPAMLLAVPYLYAASFLTALINDGASNWFYVVSLACIWNALKFIANGIMCTGLLVRVRLHERRLRRSIDELASQPAEQLVGV